MSNPCLSSLENSLVSVDNGTLLFAVSYGLLCPYNFDLVRDTITYFDKMHR